MCTKPEQREECRGLRRRLEEQLAHFGNLSNIEKDMRVCALLELMCMVISKVLCPEGKVEHITALGHGKRDQLGLQSWLE